MTWRIRLRLRMTGRLEEPVRLPGMISMDLEHETLRTRGVTVPLQVGKS